MAGWLYPQTLNPPDRNPLDRKSPDRPPAAEPAGLCAEDASSSDEAIAALVQQYAQPLYRVAFSVMRNAAEAEDAVQETFLRVLKNKNKLPQVRDARVWLVRITWNVVLDRKRRTKVRPETDDVADLVRTLPCPGPGGEAATIAAHECQRILSLIDTLPAKEREALLLSAVEELSTTEIASVLGTSESSVRSRLFRARLQLAKLLEASKSPWQTGRSASRQPRPAPVAEGAR
jgi:RNA polymerase sigma-70 factor (ECF subfamily)